MEARKLNHQFETIYFRGLNFFIFLNSSNVIDDGHIIIDLIPNPLPFRQLYSLIATIRSTLPPADSPSEAHLQPQRQDTHLPIKAAPS